MRARVLLTTTILLMSLPIASAEQATVLCYHIIGSSQEPRMEVSRETFRQQMHYLETTGYNVIPLQHLYEYVVGKRSSIPKNAVVITLDDGWRSTYTEAYPELKKRGFPFTLFIYPKIIGRTTIALTWDQIREMAEAGADVQSHTLSHGYLTRRHQTGLDDAQYAAWLETELVESKRIIEKKVGRDVNFLAYPYGDYDTRVAAAAEKAGYFAGLTCDYGRVKPGTNPLRMKRVVIDKTMNFADFRHYMGAAPMELAEIKPAPGRSAEPGQTVVSARIPNFESLDPQSVRMALLTLDDVQPYAYDANTGAISLLLNLALDELNATQHRAVVWATDAPSGRRVEASWTFHIPEPEPSAPVTAADAPSPAIRLTSGTTGGRK